MVAEKAQAFLQILPVPLVAAIDQLAAAGETVVYLVGGAVRDWLLGRPGSDLDLTVAGSGELFARQLLRQLGEGSLVRLGDSEEDALRLVWQGLEIDIAALRGGAICIADDLAKRDYTINSLAVPWPISTDVAPQLIDPLGGAEDLRQGLLRANPDAFTADPLRMLRGYRFSGQLDFSLTPETVARIVAGAQRITAMAAERIRHELDLIMDCPRSSRVLEQMWQSGLLAHILPELAAGDGISQPGFHHLDVLRHNLQALSKLEGLLAAQPPLEMIAACAASSPDATGWQRNLKYAALLHDIGKPAVRAEKAGMLPRATFYGHDELGRELFARLALRLRWSSQHAQHTGALIGMHMHPFHLCTLQREGKLTARAVLRLCRRAGEFLPELFALAMADSLASQGELKPADMEEQLERLYQQVNALYQERIKPVLSGPRLVTGNDLISQFSLEPGPIFAELLHELEEACVEGQVGSREEALAYIARSLAQRVSREGRLADGAPAGFRLDKEQQME